MVGPLAGIMDRVRDGAHSVSENASWIEWDCLFLIPKPWYGPVLAPVLMSGYFVLACCLLLVRETSTAKLRLSAPVLSLQLLGIVLWYWSFVKDSGRIMAQGHVGIRYSWLLFACGLASGMLGLWLAARRRSIPPPGSSTGPGH